MDVWITHVQHKWIDIFFTVESIVMYEERARTVACSTRCGSCITIWIRRTCCLNTTRAITSYNGWIRADKQRKKWMNELMDEWTYVWMNK